MKLFAFLAISSIAAGLGYDTGDSNKYVYTRPKLEYSYPNYQSSFFSDQFNLGSKFMNGRNGGLSAFYNKVEGKDNNLRGANNQVIGTGNNLRGFTNSIRGQKNNVYGLSNKVYGIKNEIKGSGNLVSGFNNRVEGTGNSIGGIESQSLLNEMLNSMNLKYTFKPTQQYNKLIGYSRY